MVWRAGDSQGNEAAKIRWELPRYTRGIGLDIGCGRCKGYPHFIGVDRQAERAGKTIMDPDIVVEDGAKLTMIADSSMNFVFSSHLLEHIEDYKAALAEWWRVIKVGGYLVLYLPHKDFYPNVGKPGSNPDHKHDFAPADIEKALYDIGSWDLMRNEERNQDDEYSFFQVYKKLADGESHKYSCTTPRPKKMCGIVRYGGWGDALQMSSVLPELKKQDYHITLYATERAHEVVQHDPNIDEVYLQDTDQVPNAHLGDFWANEAKKYDKWINLSESVEATCLLLSPTQSHGSSLYTWPTAVRDKMLGKVNYVEFQHDIAEVPYTKPLQKFYPSEEEKDWALEQRGKFGGDPLILWVLNGTSVHKIWPHIDTVFARIMLTWPNAKIVTVGSAKQGLPIYGPWEKEPRVLWAGEGVFTIRQTLAFAEVCDLVVGPETGVMSSVAMCEMPKIVFLSHSSHDNLTRDWTNTYALFSTKTKCYPCHKLHYSWDDCTMNADKDAYWYGTAQCQVDIPPEACWTALVRALKPRNAIVPVEIPQTQIAQKISEIFTKQEVAGV